MSRNPPEISDSGTSDLPARYLVVAGPTGSGKSELALRLAERFNGEVVNCDSVQVYRGFNIGAAKLPPTEWRGIPHHLLDVCNADEVYTAGRYRCEARAVCAAIAARGKLAIIVGGTGLYLRALWGQNWNENAGDTQLREELAQRDTQDLHAELRELDPERAAALHANDRVRILRAVELARSTGLEFSAQPKIEAAHSGYVIILSPPRARLHEILAERVNTMLAQGLIEEVSGLIGQGLSRDCMPMRSIGYAQVVEALQGETTMDELPKQILYATRQYAKRQYTWFKRVAAAQRLAGIDEIDYAAVAAYLRGH